MIWLGWMLGKKKFRYMARQGCFRGAKDGPRRSRPRSCFRAGCANRRAGPDSFRNNSTSNPETALQIGKDGGATIGERGSAFHPDGTLVDGHFDELLQSAEDCHVTARLFGDEKLDQAAEILLVERPVGTQAGAEIFFRALAGFAVNFHLGDFAGATLPRLVVVCSPTGARFRCSVGSGLPK